MKVGILHMKIKVRLHIAYVIYLGLVIGLFLVICGFVCDLNGLTVAMIETPYVTENINLHMHIYLHMEIKIFKILHMEIKVGLHIAYDVITNNQGSLNFCKKICIIIYLSKSFVVSMVVVV